MPLIWIPWLVCGWFAGTLAGIVGFGSALMLLPLLSMSMGARTAIPVLTVAQLLGNLSRAGFGWREIHWKPAMLFCLGAVPASVLGSLMFVAFASGTLDRWIGFVLLALLGFRHSRLGKRRVPAALLPIAGAIVGTLSAVAGTVGPLGAAIFLSLELPAAHYIATEAVTAVAMHLTKSIAYNRLAALTLAEASLGITLGGSLVIGSWTGRALISRIRPQYFTLIVESMLLVSAVILILGLASRPGEPWWKN